VDVVHHITDRRKAFSEAARVLRPSGRLCIVTDSGRSSETVSPWPFIFRRLLDLSCPVIRPLNCSGRNWSGRALRNSPKQ
jgi:ubiquinone/menaquinone biosynthesis C-methylase UbiE